MPTNATGTGGIQLAGNAGAALYGSSLITVTRLLDNLNNRLLTSDEATTWVTSNAMSTNQRATVPFATPEGGYYQSPGFPPLGEDSARRFPTSKRLLGSTHT